MSVQDTGRSFSRRPFIPITTAFAGGILLGTKFGVPPEISLPMIAVLSLGALTYRRRTATAFLLAALVCCGSLAVGLQQPSGTRIRSMIEAGEIGSEDPVELLGTIESGPEPSVDGFHLDLKLNSIGVRGARRPASGSVRLHAPIGNETVDRDYASLGLGYGDSLAAACFVDREETFRNEGTETRVAQLDAQGIDAVGTVKSPLLIRITERGSGPIRAVFELRRQVIERFRARFDAVTAGVLIASMLGNREFLDRRSAELFREGGTFHVLVISGLHITFIGGIIVSLLAVVGQSRRRQLLIGAAVLWTYAMAVGAGLPVVRAALMFTAIMIARAIFRSPDILNTLALSAFALLVWRPLDVLSPSFQLTFASVGAIAGIAFPLIGKLREIGSWRPTAETPFPPVTNIVLRRFCEILYWNPVAWRIDLDRNVWSARIDKPKRSRLPAIAQRMTGLLFEGVVVSLTAQIALLPLSIWYFNRIAFGSIILNLWVGAWLAAESFAASLTALVSLFNDELARPFAAITGVINSILLGLPEIVDSIGPHGLRVPVYSGRGTVLYVIYAVPVVFVAYRIACWDPFADKPARIVRSITVTIILAAVMALHPFSAPEPDGRLRIDFLDVGQGDSTLITFPNGETMLIDGGGRPRRGTTTDETEEFEPDRTTIGEAVVSRFLWHRGLSRIDYIVATHADADHVQGLADVARNFEVGRAFYGRHAPEDPDFALLRTAVRERGIRFTPIGSGESLAIGGVLIDILSPDLAAPRGSANNDSIVLRISFGRRSVLITADIESPVERRLIDTRENLNADVVRIAHHGSRTSSTAEFIAATNPRYAVISVGRRSPFGHPHADVVGRWRGSGARVLSTGESGTITVVTDGSDLTVKTRFE